MTRGWILALALLPLPLAAQRDTSASTPLNPVVVIAERSRSNIGSSTAAVARITAAELMRTPHATLADALRRVPGFALIDFDGLGFDPQVMVRGFYGGGEAEYVVVMVDGRPVSQLQTGLVPWDALPALASIESIEIVRGSASALYGDAAVGGVINVITKRGDVRVPIRGDGAKGNFGTWSANATFSAGVAGREVVVSGGIDHTDGFRTHAERVSARGQVSIPLVASDNATLTLTGRAHGRTFDEPGPLLASLLAQNRNTSDDLFRFDHTRDRSDAMTIDGSRRVGSRARLSGWLGGELRNTAAVRTLALAPGFGDTKERETDNTRAGAAAQFDIDDSPLPGRDHLIIGAELTHGAIDSRYYDVVTGDRDDHRASSGERGALSASGSGARTAGAIFEQYTVRATSALRLSAGARFDWLNDDFTPRAPGSGARVTASHSAVSPKLGANIRYWQRGDGLGNLYVTASRSFKAPTLDQLFDQRQIPVPFPPFSLTTSNTDLDPLRGSNIEAGVYHTAGLAGSLRWSVSASVYQMDMKNELDFDVQALRYVNIGRSRHRGLETGVVLANANAASVFANYTVQSVTSQSGDNAGKYLKAIPRRTVSGGFSASPLAALTTSVVVTNAGGVFLDDANTVKLPATTRVDAHVAYKVRGFSVFADVRNLFDARYNSSGFLDPAGSGEAYYYPAAGRAVQIGIRGGW